PNLFDQQPIAFRRHANSFWRAERREPPGGTLFRIVPPGRSCGSARLSFGSPMLKAMVAKDHALGHEQQQKKPARQHQAFLRQGLAFLVLTRDDGLMIEP